METKLYTKLIPQDLYTRIRRLGYRRPEEQETPAEIYNGKLDPGKLNYLKREQRRRDEAAEEYQDTTYAEVLDWLLGLNLTILIEPIRIGSEIWWRDGWSAGSSDSGSSDGTRIFQGPETALLESISGALDFYEN